MQTGHGPGLRGTDSQSSQAIENTYRTHELLALKSRPTFSSHSGYNNTSQVYADLTPLLVKKIIQTFVTTLGEVEMSFRQDNKLINWMKLHLHEINQMSVISFPADLVSWCLG